MAKEKNDIVSLLTNVNHMEGAGATILLEGGISYLSKKIAPKYGNIAAAALSYALIPIGANGLVKNNKELRDSIIISGKYAGLKKLATVIISELYTATALSAIKETDANKQKASFDKIGYYSKALDFLGATPPTLVVNKTSEQSSSNVPVSYNPTGSTGKELGGDGSANDLKPETGLTRY